MRICYVDEAGSTGVLNTGQSDEQPVFVIAAVILDPDRLADLTADFLRLKEKFFPGRMAIGAPYLDRVLVEIKGSELRRAVRGRARNPRRHALGFLDHFLRIAESYGLRVVGRVLVKGIATPIDSRAVYTSAIQAVISYFHQLLEAELQGGIVIADSRRKALNVNVSHSIFTQKHKRSGDQYPRLHEVPTFGHAPNHVGIQIADLLCSALISPMAADAFCSGLV